MKNTQNRIIDIKALLCRILYQWRIILVLACILALLGGGKEYFSLKKAVAANKENAVESQKNTTADGQPDLTFSKELEMIDIEIAERQDYLRNVPSFDID
ncbi:MAG: hypothetical protein J6D18_04665, partial [Erysipelotrichaceae bacterium]|nr:hypothetical protein [Erysipelotrichaceae bacterium]